MTDRSALRRLYWIDALFSQLTGNDLFLARQIEGAIVRALETSDAPADENTVREAAVRLRAALDLKEPEDGFLHLDAADPVAGAPLFARARVGEGLRHLAAGRQGTIMVTNLRAGVRRGRRRWTPRLEHEYQESLDVITKTAAANTRPSANLKIIIL